MAIFFQQSISRDKTADSDVARTRDAAPAVGEFKRHRYQIYDALLYAIVQPRGRYWQ